MKNILNKLILSSLMVALFASCKKDETKVTYESGTSPVLSASSTASLVLTKANASQHAITFYWTNPEYHFSTGISSQDVTYYLEMDLAGADFQTPNNLGAIPISKDLSIDLNDSVLNSALAKVGENGLEVGVSHNLQFRIKSTIKGGDPVLYSNIVGLYVTPYLDVAVPIPPTGELYLTGSGAQSGWTNSPPATQKFTQVSPVEYSLIVNLTPGLQIKFLSTLGNWQPQYGLATGQPVGTLGANMGGGNDPTEIATPDIPGTYKITVLFVPGKYKFEKQ